MDVLGWMKHKLESRLPGEISITSNMQTHRPDGRKWTETKESPAGGERRKWKSWLKTQCSKNEDHGIRSHHFMANRWGNNVNSDRLYFLGSKITADGDCSHEIKRCLLLRRKVMTNLDSILKSRDIILLTKVCLVKAMFFPVVMYGCESWNTKKTEHWRIDAFKLCCWRRPLRVSWTARRSNQSILKEISPEYAMEGLMLKLKLQYSGHLMQRTNLLEKKKIPDSGKDCRREEKGMTKDKMVERHHWLNDMNLNKLWELEADREVWRAVDHGFPKSQTWLNDWSDWIEVLNSIMPTKITLDT